MGADTNSWCRLGFGEPSAAYTSATQQARHLTEGWMAEHGFCPACPADRLPPLPNNTRVGDFRCADCGEEYELKGEPKSPPSSHGGASPARAEGVKDAPGGRAAARWPQAILDSLRPAGTLAGKAMKGDRISLGRQQEGHRAVAPAMR